MARCRLVSQNRKIPTCPGHFSTSELHLSWQAQGILHVAKSIKTLFFFLILSKNVGRRGGFEEKLHFSWQGQHIGNFDMPMLRGRSAHFVRGVAPLKF